MLRGRRIPASLHTASEPQARNGLPGAPVKASMSDGGFRRNQGGTVEYFCIPPLILFRGWVFFIPFSRNHKGGKPNGKRKSVHL